MGALSGERRDGGRVAPDGVQRHTVLNRLKESPDDGPHHGERNLPPGRAEVSVVVLRLESAQPTFQPCPKTPVRDENEKSGCAGDADRGVSEKKQPKRAAFYSSREKHDLDDNRNDEVAQQSSCLKPRARADGIGRA